MKRFNHQKRCGVAVARPKLFDLINLASASANSSETRQPFQRLVSELKTVETVFPFSFADTGLKPGVNEKTVCIFHAL